MNKKEIMALVAFICKAITLAMGVAVTVLTALKVIDITTAVSLLGIGLFCAGLSLMQNDTDKKNK